MKIAQIAPLMEAVPPKLYGGSERVVSYLTEELVRQGHDVTLFASGDSRTSAQLAACCDVALRLNPLVRDPLPHYLTMVDAVARRVDEFDILHFHIDLLHFPIIRPFAGRTVTTLHGRLDLPDLVPFYQAFSGIPLVSISDDQRRPLPPVNWIGTVHHGLPIDLLRFNGASRGGYLAFLGRISPEKGPEAAIEIARRSGLPLKMAAKIDKVDQPWWEGSVKGLVESSPHVEFIGEIDEAQKSEFLGGARALLFPIDWPEPFGMVVIEAMACGTPVIAFRRGSVPELIDDGVTGFVVDTVDAAVDAVLSVDMLDRAAIRRRFENRFSAERMAHDYVRLYERLIEARVSTVRERAITESAASLNEI